MSKFIAEVDIVKKPWESSPYYEDAERWTYLFWNDGTPFYEQFKKLDLTCVAGTIMEGGLSLTTRKNPMPQPDFAQAKEGGRLAAGPGNGVTPYRQCRLSEGNR